MNQLVHGSATVIKRGSSVFRLIPMYAVMNQTMKNPKLFRGCQHIFVVAFYLSVYTVKLVYHIFVHITLPCTETPHIRLRENKKIFAYYLRNWAQKVSIFIKQVPHNRLAFSCNEHAIIFSIIHFYLMNALPHFQLEKCSQKHCCMWWLSNGLLEATML